MKKADVVKVAGVAALCAAGGYVAGIKNGVTMTYFAMENSLAAEIRATYRTGGLNLDDAYAKRMAREQMANLRASFKANRRLAKQGVK